MDGKLRGGKIKIQSEFNSDQNVASLESISQTVQKLQHFQMVAFRNSRWRLVAKMAEFFDVAWQIDF
jgi:hypothetical protein